MESFVGCLCCEDLAPDATFRIDEKPEETSPISNLHCAIPIARLYDASDLLRADEASANINIHPEQLTVKENWPKLLKLIISPATQW